MPAFAGMTAIIERIILKFFFWFPKERLSAFLNNIKICVMPAKAGIPFGSGKKKPVMFFLRLPLQKRFEEFADRVANGLRI